LSLSAPTFNAKAMVGYRAGALDVGFVTGGLLTSSFAADATSAQPAPVPPDSLRLVHAGGFVGWRPSRAQRLSIGGRLEGAYAWLPRTSAYPAFPGAGEAAVGTATAYGAIGAFDVAYAPISTPRASVVIGLELFAGALRGEYGDSLRILPRGAAASVGVRWQ
jgi:hypothetical protein